MALTLQITNVDTLENGGSTRLRIDRYGVTIGRQPQEDWCLPDPGAIISSRHCHIDYRDGGYWLVDHSTNGTFVSGRSERLVESEPYRLRNGDEISIGHYRIAVRLDGEDAVEAPAPKREWIDWGGDRTLKDLEPDLPEWPVEPRPTGPEIRGYGAMSPNFTPPSVLPAPTAESIWDRIRKADGVDWNRGFEAPAAPTPPPVTEAKEPTAPQPNSLAPSEAWTTLLSAAGLAPSDVPRDAREGLDLAGDLLRRFVGGMVVMLEARARAKRELGIVGTEPGLGGANPLKFARTPRDAVAQLLGGPGRKLMAPDQAIDEAFKDLQAHQMATLLGMRGALRATIARFSPAAIRKRADRRGLLAQILPGAREAELWRAYEREFEGVAHGSDEAFMDVFGREFKKAYVQAVSEMRR